MEGAGWIVYWPWTCQNQKPQCMLHADFRNFIVQGYEIGYETLRADPMACPR